MGRAKRGTAEGRKGAIIKELTAAKSVDFVTVPGAGGKVLELFEAARNAPQPEKETAVDEQQAQELRDANAALTEQVETLTSENARLQEALLQNEAEALVRETLAEADLPEPARERLQKALAGSPVIVDGELDREAYTTQIQEAAQAEKDYLASVVPQNDTSGEIPGLGETLQLESGTALNMPNIQINMTGRSAGEEISSTYEGRHLSVLESAMVHPTHADGFVDGGDPVLIGNETVGVAFTSASAATDYIAVDTEGIWALVVLGTDDGGNSAVAEGDEIYINRTTAVLSKISNFATHQPFGYALSPADAGSTTTVVAVKVHFDIGVLNQTLNYANTTSGSYGLGLYTYLAGGATEGLTAYFEGHLTAAQTGNIYGLGSWINVDSTNLMSANIMTPFEGGIWAGTAQAAGRVVFAGQHHAILTSAPATSLHAWRLNSTQTVTAVIAAANPGTVGYVASGAETSTMVGAVPLFDIVGAGVVWVRLYDAAT
jgi:hypothetical protein